MPAIATPKPDADSFLIMATEVHKLLTRPVGTEHARIRQLAKVLRDLANTNYDRGWNDALEAGEVAVGTVDSAANIEDSTHMVAGSRVRIEGAPFKIQGKPFNGRIGRVRHIGEDVVTLSMEDDEEIMGVNKVYLKLIF